MATLVTRSGKGSPLTHAEVDANFTNLNTDKLELSGGTMTGNLSFGDNDKAIFGAGSDLQIYSDGANSIIQETDGTGNLLVRASNINLQNSGATATLAQFIDGGKSSLRYNGSEKLATTSTGVDITGTLTSDGLTVDGTTAIPVVIDSNQTDTAIQFKNSGYDDAFIEYNDNNLFFYTDNKRFLSLASNGDISFYEDTGTTAKFFWDASAERLGIGTTAPSTILHLTDTHPSILFETSGGGATDQAYIQKYSNDLYIYNKESAGKLFLGTNNATKATIDSSGNVGIGATSPASKLQVDDANNVRFSFTESGTGHAYLTVRAGYNTKDSQITFSNNTNSTTGSINYDHTSNFMKFSTNGNNERMRIDSNGNLLVGTTSTDPAAANSEGIALSAGSYGGFLSASRSIATANTGTILRANRKTSDGNIVELQKDGTTVGSIGNDGAILQMSSASTGGLFVADNGTNAFGFANGENAFRPASDNTINLGKTDRRFKDLYLSGGVYLGGTGAANKLDDYEEGSFTATATPETSGTITLQSAVNTLAYTKIGHLCTIQGLLNVTSVSSPVGDAIAIATLPFTAANLTEFAGRAVVSVVFRDNSTSTWSNEVAWLDEGGTSFNIYKDASTLASNDQFYISLTYRTA